MLIKRPSDIPPSEITPRSIFHDRRRFMRDSAGIATTALLGASGLSLLGSQTARALATDKDATGQKLEGVVESAYRVDEELTPYTDITNYNNSTSSEPTSGTPRATRETSPRAHGRSRCSVNVKNRANTATRTS